MNGIRVAKPGLDVNRKSDKRSVDSTTPLFKVKELVQGALNWDGTNAKWQGDHIGVRNSSSSFELHIPHGLNYIPTFLMYMDTTNNGNRKYVSTTLSGISLTGDLRVFANVDENFVHIYMSSTSALLPGLYGYTLYIMWDELGAG
jgi:hypothetical protein